MSKKHIQYRGIRKWMAAEVIEDTIEKIEYGEPFPITSLAEVSRATNSESQMVYYDNEPELIDDKDIDDLTFKSSVIPDEALSKITGQYYDEDKGLFVEGSRKSKFYATGYVAKKTDGSEVFVWRLKGKFEIPSSTHVTEDGSTSGNGQEVKYTGIETTHKFTMGDEKIGVRSVAVDTSVNPVTEDSFFGEVHTPDMVEKNV